MCALSFWVLLQGFLFLELLHQISPELGLLTWQHRGPGWRFDDRKNRSSEFVKNSIAFTSLHYVAQGKRKCVLERIMWVNTGTCGPLSHPWRRVNNYDMLTPVPAFSRDSSPQLISLRPETTPSRFTPHFGVWYNDFLPSTSTDHCSSFACFLKAHVNFLAANTEANIT